MASRTYENFDLLVESTGEAGHRVRVIASPTGETPSIPFTLPFDPTVLENLLLKLDPGRSGTRRMAANPQVQAGRDFGGPLFDAVFAGDVALAWSRAQDTAARTGRGVRLRLRLTDAPALAGLPWELLYERSSNAFIAQSERTPLVRYLDVPRVLRPLSVGGALRILVVISSPTDLDELDTDAEWARVNGALAERISAGQVVVDRLPAPTVAELGKWLRTHDVNVLHFVGHGDFDTRLDDGVLYFCDAYGRSNPVTSSVLGPYVHDHDPLRLVVLNACRSARADSTDPYSGMAQGLVQQDATAVVAMQFPISDGAAVAFTGDFYGAIADGLPVDQAVTSARKNLNADFGAEWATPILFLRADDGDVFEGVVAEVPVPAASPEHDQDFASTTVRSGGVALSDTAPLAGMPPQPADPTGPVDSPTPADLIGPADPTRPDRIPADPGAPRRRWWLALLAVPVLALIAWVARPGGTPTPHPTGSTTSSGAKTSSGSSTVTSSPKVTTRAAAPGPVIVAAAFTAPPTIDANPADWAGRTAYKADKVIAGGPRTVSASWQLGWDADNYYIYVTVTDADITQTHAAQPSQVYNGDSVSFEIGTFSETVHTDTLSSRDKHVLIGPTEAGGVVRAMNLGRGSSFERGEPFTSGQVVVALTPAGYDVEAAIPWDTLGVSDPHAGKVLASNLNVSDAVASGLHRGDLAAMESNNAKRTSNAASLRYLWGQLKLS